jgi:hypothetical protein
MAARRHQPCPSGEHDFEGAGALSLDRYNLPIRHVQCQRCGLGAEERYVYLGTFVGDREVGS